MGDKVNTMTPEQREAKRARWRKWYNANRTYRHKAPKHARTCQYCNKEFTSYKSDAKFCSRDCRVTSWRNSGVTIITTNQAARELREIRKEEGLDRPVHVHVCDTSRFGYCVPCRLRAMREGGKVHLTEEHTRNRTRRNYHTKKYEVQS